MKVMFTTLILLVLAGGWGAFFSNWGVDVQLGCLLIAAMSFALILMALIPTKKKKNLEI